MGSTRRFGVAATLALGLVAAACTPSEEPTGGEAGAIRLQTLGEHHHPITTSSERTQRYFDQGLNLSFAFNHELAALSFREALESDPECAMCYWGLALVLGPNINAPMGPEAAGQAWEALLQARARMAGASEVERGYIEALSKRYAEDPAAPRAPLDRAYAEAMGELHRRFPDDIDAATLYAEALMDLYPWDYWIEKGVPRPETAEALRVLESVIERAPMHPGANHFWIHALEEFEPERAEAAADRLATIAPDAGHLVHMPSHIYWRVGRYQDAAAINSEAVAVDESLFAWCSNTEFYAAGYYTHNIHFLWAAAMASGQSDRALTAARRLHTKIPAELVPTYPFLEDFLAVPHLTLARFARWDAVLAEPPPPESQRYVTATWYYTRGLAFARKGDLEAAEHAQAALADIAADPELDAEIYDVSGNTAGQRLAIARHHLEAEIASARGDRDAAIAALEAGVSAQDALNYIEPPAWYLPTRELLGAELLEAGRAEDAEAVYRANLERYPRNGWALRGLALALERQGREVDADWVRRGFERAWSEADVKLDSSRL